MNIRDAEGNVRSAGDLMPEIADALASIESPAERAAISVDLFGRAGQKLEALLEGGSAGLRGYAEQAHALGTVLSSEEIAEADRVADDLAKLNFQIEAQQNRKLLENGDAILRFEETLSDLKLGLIDANNQMQTWVDEFDAFNARNAETTRAFYKRIGDWAASIPDRIGTMVVDTRAAIGRFVANMVEMGRDMIAGLVRGIVERAGRVRDAVTGTVSDAVDSARNFLGIRSPSRLFMAMGGFVAEGFALGITGSSSLATNAVRTMVDGIAAQMQRLDASLVRPAATAAEQVAWEMEQMARDTQNLLDRLFPEVRQLLEYRRELALIDGSGLSDTEKREARVRLGTEGNEPGRIDVFAGRELPQLDIDLGPLAQHVRETGQDIEDANVRIAQSFKDMADQAIASVRGLIDGIKSGDFLSILQGVLGIGLQIAGIVTGNAGLAGSIPRFATGTNYAPGGLALVGERGPELVNLPRGSQVIPNNQLGGAGGRLQVEVVANNNGFGAIVRNAAGEVVAQAAPSLMQGGAQLAQSNLSRRSTRRVG